MEKTDVELILDRIRRSGITGKLSDFEFYKNQIRFLNLSGNDYTLAIGKLAEILKV